MSNLNLNKVILCGRLTADPDLKTTQQSNLPVVSFTLAVNRRTRSTDGNAQQMTDFISCVAWRQNAEFITRFFKKGSALCVVGSLQVRKWTDAQNQNRYSTEVVVEDAMFVDSKTDGGPVPFASGESYAAPAAAESFDVIKNEDDLPF